jgi:hydroxymethylpyrimidine pyrophosphatase-like HAD family hydrolase
MPPAAQAVYLDLDGTLLGPDGASADGLEAVAACRARDVEVVLMSGRSRQRVAEHVRRLGLSSWVCEAGGCVVIDGTAHWLTGELVPSARDGTVFDQIAASGAPARLRRHFDGRLVPHAPYHRGRDVSHLFRGDVDVDEADALLAAHGHDGLRLLDNGLAQPATHVYHLLPRQTSKAGGVALHQRLRGYDPSRCLAIGDSREDLAVAPEVGALWLVANAIEADPSLAGAATAHANVRVASARYGSAVLESVTSVLAHA